MEQILVVIGCLIVGTFTWSLLSWGAGSLKRPTARTAAAPSTSWTPGVEIPVGQISRSAKKIKAVAL
jgi:hypothetical protein